MLLHARRTRPLATILFAALAAVAAVSGGATASSALLSAAGLPAALPVDQRPPVGSIGVYFDAAYTQQSASVPAAFVPFTFYVVAKNLAAPGVLDGIGAYEFGLQVPVGLLVTGGRTLPPGYTDFGSGDDNWIVGTGGCRPFLSNGGDTYLLATYASCLFLSPPEQNLSIRVGQATPPSFDPPTPGFLSCEEGALFPFATSSNGRINPLVCNLSAATIAGAVVTGRDSGGGSLFTYDAGKPVTAANVGDVNGDGESDLLLYTASDGVNPGSVTLLNCQGGVIWDFTSSGGCVVTNGIVDVTSVELGDFDTGTTGQELLVIARANPANGAAVTRVTLLNPDGTVHKANVALAQEYWVLGDMPVHAVGDVAGVRSLILAGDNTTFAAQPLAYALRLRLDNLRGQAPVRPAGAACVLGTQVATALWNFQLGISGAAVDPYFQQETKVTGLSVAGEVGTFTMASGATYDLILADLQPPTCAVATVALGPGDSVVGSDGLGTPIWTYMPPSPPQSADLVQVGGRPVVLLTTQPTGARPNSILALECHGKPMALFDGNAASCVGTGDTPVLSRFGLERLGAPPAFGGVFHALYSYPNVQQARLDRTDVRPDARSLAPDASYAIPGAVDVFIDTVTGATPAHVFLLGVTNSAGGASQVIALDAASLSGSAPPLLAGCTAGGQLWSALFDGTGGYPAETGGVTGITVDSGTVLAGVLRVTMQSGAQVLLDAATGALIPSCTLASVETAGATLRGLDGSGGELWQYGAGSPVLEAFLRDLDGDGIPEAVGLAQTVGDTPAHFFAVDCSGTQVYSTAVAALDCFGASSALPEVNGTLTDFATGLIVLDDGAGEVAQIAGADLVAGSVLGTYAHRGSLSSVLRIAQNPQPDLIAAVGRNVALDAGVAFAIPFGYTGTSAPGCASPLEKRFDSPWYDAFDGSSPDFPREAAIASVAVEGDALHVTAEDGTGYLLLALDGTPVPCELVAVQPDGHDIVGYGPGSAEIWRTDMGSTVQSGALMDLGGTTAPEVIVATALDGANPGQIVALTCAGQMYWTFDSTAADCWGEQSSPAPQSIERLYTGVDLAGNGGSDLLAITQLASGTAYRVVQLDNSGQVSAQYWHRGGFADALLTNLSGDAPLDLVILGASGAAVGSGPADLLRLVCTSIDGAAPPDAGTCGAGSQQWWLVWDGSIDGLPSENQPLDVTLAAANLLQVQMDGGGTYSITADGQPLTDVVLSLSTAGPAAPGDEVVVTMDGSNLSRLAGLDGTVSYDADLLSFVDATAGALLVQAGGFSTVFNGATLGTISFAAARATQLGGGAATGELVQLRLRVADDAPTGVVPVVFATINVFDEQAAGLGVQTQDGGVDVSCVKLDVSGDGSLHSNDAVLALRISAGLLQPDARQACAADADSDGEVNAGDAVLILRAIVGLPVAGTAPLAAADPRHDAAVTSAHIALDGAAWREADGTVIVPLVLSSDREVAGLDLTLRASSGAFLGAALASAAGEPSDGALVYRIGAGSMTLAAAASNRLARDGQAHLWVRVQGVPAAAASLQLTAASGVAFDTRAARSTLPATDLNVALGEGAPVPALRTELRQNQPNPFNPRTEIHFVLAHEAAVRLTILDMAGRMVATLMDGRQGAGEHAVVWNGVDDLGMPVASGVYLYQLQADGERQVRRMALVR